MNPMMAAIKKKKGMLGDHASSHEAEHVDDQAASGSGHGLHEFVAGLNDQEKGQLKQILDKAGKGMAHGVEKGGPSSHEQELIAKEASKENESNQMEQAEHDMPGGDSDDIAMSMLDHKAKTAPADYQPRNLGERVKFGLAQKLKGKGKL